jgi:hypothetical protein
MFLFDFLTSLTAQKGHKKTSDRDFPFAGFYFLFCASEKPMIRASIYHSDTNYKTFLCQNKNPLSIPSPLYAPRYIRPLCTLVPLHHIA